MLFVIIVTVLIIEAHIYYAASVNAQYRKQRLQLSHNAASLDTLRVLRSLQGKGVDLMSGLDVIEGIKMANTVSKESDESNPLTVLGVEASTSVVASILTTLVALLSSIASAFIQSRTDSTL